MMNTRKKSTVQKNLKIPNMKKEMIAIIKHLRLKKKKLKKN